MTLEEFFEEHPKIALAFSGGVDSSYLLYAASRCGADVAAYYVKSQFQPEFELRDAIELLDNKAAYERMARAVNPYGDGNACQRIADAIEWHFGLREARPTPFVPR